MTILDLKDCFKEDFINWLAKSNNPKLPYIGPPDIVPMKPTDKFLSRYQSELSRIAEESLQDILDILLREPEADYFWYGYPEHGSKLSYSLPHHDTVPGSALRVDKEKIKSFLRNWKLEKLGIC